MDKIQAKADNYFYWGILNVALPRVRGIDDVTWLSVVCVRLYGSHHGMWRSLEK